MTRVELSKAAEKALLKLPHNVVAKLLAWASLVEKSGLAEARQSRGYNDEALQGVRAGQRSIRLSHVYRAIYVVSKDGAIELVTVIDANRHKY